MQNLQNPRWLLLTQTLCALLLGWLFYDAYDTIHTQLSPQSKSVWKNFALVWTSFSIFSLGYALFRIWRKEKISFWYDLTLVITQVMLLILSFMMSSSLFPFDIPRWMLPGDMNLYALTFLMPGIVHGMLNLASQPLKQVQQETPFPYLAAAFAIPAVLYLGGILMMSVGSRFEFFEIAFPVTFAVVLTLLFSYAVTRGLYLFAVKKSASLNGDETWIRTSVTILLPLVGLLLNSFHTGEHSVGIFGNFSHPATYVLLLLNGLFLTVPFLRRPTLLFFLFRAGLFSFSLYFFLVFLPFLPLSLLAVIAMGIGILMLTPLAVFVLHATKLSQDYTALRSRYSASLLWFGGVGMFLLIPAFITGLFLMERNRFNEAIDYVYAPDYHREYRLDNRAVLSTLRYLRQQKEEVGFSQSTPYLSSWYKRIVLGRQTLNESKIGEMERIFSVASLSGRKENFWPMTNRPSTTATLQDIQTNSRYDADRKLWISDLHLKIVNPNTPEGVEYTTDVILPAGCTVSDYYLDINGKRERGMLAEKKSALWVFNNIVNVVRRDPGIVYYAAGNRIRIRVFPVMQNEVRTTGLQLLHPEPVSLLFDGRQLQLGITGSASSPTLETEHFIRLSSSEVLKLPQQVRKPYFHFLVDAHEGNNANFASYAAAIRDLNNRYPQLLAGAQMSLVSSVAESAPYKTSWATDAGKKPFSGGFFLERALRQSLVKSYEEGADRYPVFVVCADSLRHAVLSPDFADLQFCFPETPFFYHLLSDGRLQKHPLLKDSRTYEETAAFPPAPTPVRRWQERNHKVYLPDTPAPAFVLKKPLFEVPDSTLQPSSETAALTLRALEQSILLSPNRSDETWKTLVRTSMNANMLSTTTAFMVVENEAQRQVLRKKQEAMLSGKAALSAGEAEEEVERMSEPDVFIVLGILGLGVLVFRARKKQSRRLVEPS